MEPHSVQRKPTAILSADVKGYSRLMGKDEEATLLTLRRYRTLMITLIQQHQGRAVGSAGDSLLAEFASVVDAVQCATVIQTTLKAENAHLPPDKKMEFRIGINLGDVMVDGEQIYGDGVNIAARLEGLADPGGICISGTVHEHIENKLPLAYEYLGEQTVKNIAKPVRVYRIQMEPGATPVTGKDTGEGPSSPQTAGTQYWQKIAVVIVGLALLGTVGLVLKDLFSGPVPPLTKVLAKHARALTLPDKPSIAVLPFVNMSGDPMQEYSSDGITEAIITDLSKISGLFVIARNSVFTYKGKAIKVTEVSRDLGVRYVLEGSVQKAGNHVRINVQLVDAITGGHLWAERYDQEVKDIFALQDEITQKIVFALKVNLTPEEQARFRKASTNNLEAYDTFLRGLEHYQRFTKEGNLQARQLWERASTLDPEYAAAYAALGWTYFQEWVYSGVRTPRF